MQPNASADFHVKQEVSKYYGETLSSSADLKTSACCDPTALPPQIAAALANVHEDVVRKYYGCGLCLPPDHIDGLHVLDLGCGSGRDCFILSQLVGASGRVTGIDMTEEQLTVRARMCGNRGVIVAPTGGARI
jgi:arsenite methyltransferase